MLGAGLASPAAGPASLLSASIKASSARFAPF